MSSNEPRWTQTWLGGLRSAGVDLGYPGQRLGLPEEGSGSVSGWGRRIAALVIDWMICTWAITQLLLGISTAEQPWVPAIVFAVQYVVLVGFMGQTFGHRLAGIRVAAMDGGDPRLFPVLVRTVLLVLALPALIFDRDHRGLHDRVSNTVVVRM
ncbi:MULTISPECIES: RDD family protein [Nonomuraea]|uniref:RDD family protein n=1 Tax=Nonomuraea ferruginea TaxID=46174 RepID=A0ABT4T4X5_9ACTN|nr:MULTISPECIES: RDD family protein [Nonomuraea]MDA0644548.1 RDD family protein [Nonomuraea ferruginea]TXK42048.1 RDD family protein [Nonomuraea sp. C10]